MTAVGDRIKSRRVIARAEGIAMKTRLILTGVATVALVATGIMVSGYMPTRLAYSSAAQATDPGFAKKIYRQNAKKNAPPKSTPPKSSKKKNNP